MKRINLMSKRKKTLLKKAMEMSQMFSLDVLLIIQDDHMNKIIQYSSEQTQHQLFTIEKAMTAYKQAQAGYKKHILVTDELYD